MADKPKRPEATHRQQAALSTGADVAPVIGVNGRPMAMVSGACSDLTPTVQFGNVLTGPVTITRWVEDDGDDSDDFVLEKARLVQRQAQTIVGSERRLLQWAIDPSLRVTTPSGNPVEGIPHTPAPPTAPAAEQPAPPPPVDLPTPPSAQ
jgi:hypothetical protein